MPSSRCLWGTARWILFHVLCCLSSIVFPQLRSLIQCIIKLGIEKSAQSHKHIPTVIPVVYSVGVGSAGWPQHPWPGSPREQVAVNDVHSDLLANKPQAEHGLYAKRKTEKEDSDETQNDFKLFFFWHFKRGAHMNHSISHERFPSMCVC